MSGIGVARGTLPGLLRAGEGYVRLVDRIGVLLPGGRQKASLEGNRAAAVEVVVAEGAFLGIKKRAPLFLHCPACWLHLGM